MREETMTKKEYCQFQRLAVAFLFSYEVVRTTTTDVVIKAKTEDLAKYGY